MRGLNLCALHREDCGESLLFGGGYRVEQTVQRRFVKAEQPRRARRRLQVRPQG